MLIISMALTTAMGQERPATAEETPPSLGDGQSDADDERLTPAEEREARAVAARFEEHMLSTCEVAPLLEELYVRDFGPRLQRGADTVPFIARPEGAAAGAAFTEDELRRFYIALMNLWCAGFQLYAVHEPARDADGVEVEPKFEQVFPAGAAEVLKSDPSFMALYSDATGVEAEDGDESEEAFIKSPEQMRAFTESVERAVRIIREHLANHPNRDRIRETLLGAETGRDSVRPRLTTFDREYYGFPAGTRLVCANALMFHLDMVRVGGRLRIVTAYLNSD